MTALEAKSDVLWNELRARGVPNVAIGDLGNEIGMGTIGEHIKKICALHRPRRMPGRLLRRHSGRKQHR